MPSLLFGALATAALAAASDYTIYGVTVPIAPAAEPEVREALDACAAITFSDWIDVARLRGELRWRVDEHAQSRDGAGGGIFRKPGNAALVIVGTEDFKRKRCLVVARLASASEYHPLAEKLSATLGAPIAHEGSSYAWQRAAATVHMLPSGNRTQPNVEFATTSRQNRNDKR